MQSEPPLLAPKSFLRAFAEAHLAEFSKLFLKAYRSERGELHTGTI